MKTETISLVFRLGIFTVGPGYVTYYNQTAHGEARLNAAQEARWRAWMIQKEKEGWRRPRAH